MRKLQCLFTCPPLWDCTWWGDILQNIWLKGNDCLTFSVVKGCLTFSGWIIVHCGISGNRKTEEVNASIKAQPIGKMREYAFCPGWNQLLFWRLLVQSIIITFSGEHNYAWRVRDEPDSSFWYTRVELLWIDWCNRGKNLAYS